RAHARRRRPGRHSGDRIGWGRHARAHVRGAHDGRCQRGADRVDRPLRHPHDSRGEGVPRRTGSAGAPGAMSWLGDLLGVYGRVLRRTFDLTVQNWWLGLVAIVYQGMLLALMLVLGPLGMVGGFLMGFAIAALMSSWLFLVGHVVRAGRTTLADLPGSFVVHLGDVLTFGFLLWALQYIASIA